MSKYATLLSIDGDTDDSDHLGVPYEYRGSHILPDQWEDRYGWVEVAGIPAFCGNDPTQLVDFLRLDVSATDDGDPSVTVLLDRRQVEALRDCLTQWLEREPENE